MEKIVWLACGVDNVRAGKRSILVHRVVEIDVSERWTRQDGCDAEMREGE